MKSVTVVCKDYVKNEDEITATVSFTINQPNPGFVLGGIYNADFIAVDYAVHDTTEVSEEAPEATEEGPEPDEITPLPEKKKKAAKKK